jgi:predicted AAA+ superfamily ATPase
MQKIRPFIDTSVVKVITGIRRCGKSVMMELVQVELKSRGVSAQQILALNFESGTDNRIKNAEAVITAVRQVSAAANKRIYLFFDEIQELTGWETLINSLLVDFDADIYLTGSNAHMLSGELATYLAGRYVEIRMYPFSFQEVLALLDQRESTLSREQAFQLYLVRGGFPFLYNYRFSETDARQYLSDVFDSIILKDIAQRHQVRDIGQLRRLVQFFMAGIGNTFSAGSLTKYLKNGRRSLSTETIYNYIEYGRSACLIHLVRRQDLIGKAILATQEKIYLTDHGIREAILGTNLRDINQVLENMVYIELLRRGYEVTVGKVKNTEVDFCAEKSDVKCYVQVAYILATDETMDREFGVLETIPDNYPKFVVSLDEIDRSRNGIIHRNIRDFLLYGDI